MADGWDAVAQESELRRERREQWESSRHNKLILKDGQSADVRFVQPKPHTFYTHPIRTAKSFRNVPCLNQKDDGTQCPGCDADLKRQLRIAFNVIHRGRPVLRKGSDGRAERDGKGDFIIDGHADDIAVFECSSTSGDLLRQKEVKYEGGVMSRDVTIARTGPQFSPFVFEAADTERGHVPMSAADQELAKKAYDLEEIYKPPSFVDLARQVGLVVPDDGDTSGGGQGGGAERGQSNIFEQTRDSS
jgi:hypothetical protein